MSHFTVIVRLSAQRLAAAGDNVEMALKEILAPFCEHTDDPSFREFVDTEADDLAKYETETRPLIELPGGVRLEPWDERFRVPGTIGTGGGSHTVPGGAKRIEVPLRECYPTFEAFMADYCGHESRDPKTNRYGYWSNPNAKWDWYCVGGRWTGFFPVKNGSDAKIGKPGLMTDPAKIGTGDIVRFADLDTDRVALESRAAADKFWGEWQQLLDGKRFDVFDGPRSSAISLGLIEVRRGPPLPGEESRAVIWSRDHSFAETDERRNWHDVYAEITRAEFDARHLDYFTTIRPYATLDDDGWKEPGRMGWFGASSDTPETVDAFARAFPAWLRATAIADVLVAVDCHI